MPHPAITRFVVANFRKHKLPIISEEGFFFWPVVLKVDAFPTDFHKASIELYKYEIKYFISISYILFYNLKFNSFFLIFKD